jgi:hypothetical protein
VLGPVGLVGLPLVIGLPMLLFGLPLEPPLMPPLMPVPALPPMPLLMPALPPTPPAPPAAPAPAPAPNTKAGADSARTKPPTAMIFISDSSEKAGPALEFSAAPIG